MVGQVLEVARTTIEKGASVKLTSFEACTWRLKDKRVSACQKVNLGMPVERCRALTFRAAWILKAHVTCMFSLLFDSPGKHLGHREGGHCEKGI